MNFYYGVNESFKQFSTFHYVFMAFFLVVIILAVIFFRKCKDKTLRIITFVAWVIIVGFEIGKQFNWATDISTRELGPIALQAFPYQFCSLPLYLWPLFIFLPDSKFRNCLGLFLGTFVFFTGFGYLFVGSSICSRVFISHQTMIHHGLQATIGLLIFVHEYKKYNLKMFFQCSVFLILLAPIAVVLNIIIYPYEPAINLWEMNPLNPSQAIVYKQVFEATNYPVFYITYLILFTALALAFYFIEKGGVELVYYLNRKYKKKTISKQ